MQLFENLRVQNIENIAFKVVQMKFLVMNIILIKNYVLMYLWETYEISPWNIIFT